MKKAILILLGSILLFGCSNDKQEEPEETPEVEVEEVEDEVEQEVEEPVEEAEPVEEPEEEVVQEANNEHLKEFTEYTVISHEINLDVHKGEVETDNPGNRIILFADESGKKIYKSIFVKNDNHLKIVELDGEGLLFNDTINE